MASQIDFQSIDAAFPVAGKDNDTQGFRDNFSYIKTGLGNAQLEITDLQANTAKLDQVNNFNGTNLVSPNLSRATSEVRNIGSISGDFSISFLNGHYQTAKVNSASILTDELTITLSDWPVVDGDQNYAVMRVHLSTLPQPTRFLTTVNWIINAGGALLIDQSWPKPFVLDTDRNTMLGEDSTVDQGGPIIVEFWTYDGGNTVYGKYLGIFSSVI